MKKSILSLIIFVSSPAVAQKRYTPSDIPKMPRMEKPSGLGLRYDVSGSSGTRQGKSYTEIKLGISYQMNEWMKWRNEIFQQFGSELATVSGLDSSLRIGNRITSETNPIGIDFYVGPGVRAASHNLSSYFAEAGLGFKIGGIYLGVGAKSLRYFKTEENGVELPKGDTEVFFAIGGGGNL